MRVIIELFLVFLLPTAAYYVYMRWSSGHPVSNEQFWDEAPLIWLTLAGILVAGIFLIAVHSSSGGGPGQVYVPAQYKDGKIVPGEFK